MRILVVHNRYRSEQPSGEDIVVDRDLHLLREAGHEVLTYEQHSDDIASWGPLQKATVPGRVVWSSADGRRVAALVRQTRPDIVHVHNTFPLISAAAVVSVHRTGVPVVATLHNYRLVCASGLLLRDGLPCTDCVDHGPLPGLLHGCYRGSRLATAPVTASIALHRVARTWARHVDRFVVMTDFARRLAVRTGLPADALTVRPHPVAEAPAVREGPGSGFVYVGRLSAEKGIDLLVDAWEPGLGRLDVIGSGDMGDSMARRAAERGLDIRFLGRMESTEARRRMAQAIAVVVPSRAYETFGLSAVEAMAAGVPTVVPDHGALGELATITSGAVTFRPGDVADLRSTLYGLLDPARSVERGTSARESYLAHFSPARSLAVLEQVYGEVTGTAPAPS